LKALVNRRTQLGRSDEASFKVSAECPNLKHAALSLTQNSGSINIANIRASFNQPTRQRLSGPYHDVTFGLSVDTYHNESGEAMLFISAITTRRNPVDHGNVRDVMQEYASIVSDYDHDVEDCFSVPILFF